MFDLYFLFVQQKVLLVLIDVGKNCLNCTGEGEGESIQNLLLSVTLL